MTSWLPPLLATVAIVVTYLFCIPRTYAAAAAA